VGETCQGRQATIVGTGPNVTGTAGDDVIVTGSALNIDAGAGNDLVCVVTQQSPEYVSVDAGAGDDVVDASTADSTSPYFPIVTDLGTGMDRYIGSTPEYQNHVDANGFDDHVVGASHLRVEVTEPVRGSTGTYTWRDRPFRSSLGVLSTVVDVEIDLIKQLVFLDGTKAAEIGAVEDVTAVAPRTTLRGDDQRNDLRARGCVVHIFGEGGRDRLFGSHGRSADGNECQGKAIVYGGGGDDLISGTEGRDRLFGNGGSDELRGRQHADVMVGGGGADVIYGRGGPDVVRGGGGADILSGHHGRDTLLGNRGRDTADGGYGQGDLCIAERRRRCER
jgi:Ca2+-binding RTX toxin-like protein